MVLKITNAADIRQNKLTALLYGAPGAGKTTALGFLPGRTLVIDVDQGTTVLAGNKKVDVIRLSPDLSEAKEILSELEKKCDYDFVCVDSLSELERAMLAYLGRAGKNGGAPELGHYNQVQFRIADFCRTLRTLPATIVFTCWEEQKDVVSIGGEKRTQTRPMMSGKTGDVICGLCDIVGNLAVSQKDGKRYALLSGSADVVAKDRIFKREFCPVEEFIPKSKEKESKR